MFKKVTARVRPRTLLDHRNGFAGHWPEYGVGQAVVKPRGEWRITSIYEMVHLSQLEQVSLCGVVTDINVELFGGMTSDGYLTDIIRTSRNGAHITEIRIR